MPDVSEKSIFLTALEHESSQSRDQYLASVCGDDQGLRASVEELLRAHERSENPLDHPVPAADCMDPTVGVDEPDHNQDVGKVIGPFTLMEQIGEGGFGLVFVAKQETPVRRSVALKIIKPGTGSAEVLARFDAERQAVALMDHPNIAQIFDAGVTDDSRPYFVMELVRGVPITQFCDQRGLNLRERLLLFEDVCAATHHAHQKGVIHRDLKPSNVLVTLHDTKAVAKVIDFGVAKAVGQSLTDQTIYTRLFSMVGTPLYMSPEQASMSGLDVDTRSDIYSLGVLLYELLTGTTPFDRKRLDTVGYDEMRRIIREEEPPRPSTRLTTIDKRDQQTVGSPMDAVVIDQANTSGKTAPLDSIPSDLDWIVMKAMEKDRSRRYESAAAMATDLRRFLAEEPIEARPPSQAYRLAKFARRNRVALVSGTLITVALLVGTAASLFQASRAIKERNLKDLALQKAIAATNEATEARRGVEEFAGRLKDANALLGTARLYEDAQEQDAALNAYDQAVDLVPNYYLVWIQRAQLLIRVKLWNDAAADFAAALNLDAPVNGREWQGVAALFVMTERFEDYATLCSKLIGPTDDASDSLNWNAIRSCLVGRTDLVAPDRVADRAEQLLAQSPPPRPWQNRGPRGQAGDPGRGGVPGRGLDGPPLRPGPDGPGRVGPDDRAGHDDRGGRGGPGGRRGPDGRGGPGGPGGPGAFSGPGTREEFLPPHVKSYLAGWACLHANRIEQAIDHLENAAGENRWEAVGLVYPLLAMAHYKAGRGEMAQAALQRSHDSIEKMTDDWNGLQEPTKHWFDFVEAVVLHREATVMISGRAPVIDAKVFAMQQEAKVSLRGEARE